MEVKLSSFVNSMYQIDSGVGGNYQSKENIEWMLEYFKLFAGKIEVGCFSRTDKMARSVKELVKGIERLQNPDLMECKWFPEYGCAMCAKLVLGNSDVYRYAIYLVSLDEWKHFIRTDTRGCHSHDAFARGLEKYFVGFVQSKLFDSFWEIFDNLLATAVARALDKRTGQKHHKTPGFITAVAEKALTFKRDNENILPVGGFTDVGKHTGCEPRNTAWSLVQSVVTLLGLHMIDTEFSVDEIAALFALFDLHVVACILDDGTTANTIDTCQLIMRDAVKKGAPFFDNELYDGAKWDVFLSRVEALQVKLREQVARAAETQAGEYTLSGVTHFEGAHSFAQPSIGDLGLFCSAALTEHKTLAALRADAALNLGSTKLLSVDMSRCSATELSVWVGTKAMVKSSEETQLVANTVDQWMYSQAALLSGAEVVGMCTDTFVTQMESIVLTYRTLLQSIPVSEHHSNGRLRSELRSRELLTVWIAYCLLFKASVARHPLILSCTLSVCLDWRELSVLRLVDKRAIDAVAGVRAFLQQHKASCKPFFSLLEPDATLEFAVAFGRNDVELQRILKLEQKDAQQRMEEQWVAVQAKKVEQLRLKEVISELEINLRREEVELMNTPKYRRNSRSVSRDYTDQEERVESVRTKLNAQKSALSLTEQMPPAIIQPLPRDADNALKILFFLYMPQHLRVLARFSVMAQQMLLPRSFKHFPEGTEKTFTASLGVKDFKSCWENHYRVHSKHSLANPLQVMLKAYEEAPDKKYVYPSHIDSCYSLEHCRVWYPDTFRPVMAWDGAGFKLDQRISSTRTFNPFLADKNAMKYLAYEMTEHLATDDAKLQYFLFQLGFQLTEKVRANVGPAQEGQLRPQWLSKPQFHAFCSMRAYPQQQLRKLVIALRDKLLPLNKVPVQALLREVLYHIGEIDATKPSHFCLSWKHDFDATVGGEWLPQLVSALRTIADELKSMPKNHFHMLIVVEIAVYASQWSAEARMCARELSQTAFDWAEAVPVEGATISLILDQRAKQCLFYLYSLRAHALGPLTDADAAHICKLQLLIQNIRLFEDATQYDAQLRELTVVQEHVMTTRLAELLHLVLLRPAMLTAAVQAIVSTAPTHLPWARCAGDTACFEAVIRDQSGEDHLYSVNLLSGTFLFDGKPLKRLPRTVLSHPLYRRSFGDSNFEVTVDGATGTMTTARAVSGCIYSFQQMQDNFLRITETDPHTRITLTLLDSTEVSKWGKFLPVRLQQLHSHWYYPAVDGIECILFRPVHYLGKEVDFLYCLLDKGEDNKEHHCYRIPPHLTAKPWKTELRTAVDSFDELVHLTEERTVVTALLAKFERAEFIHIFRLREGFLAVHLPRFGLEFTVSKTGEIASKNYTDFSLSHSQQLADTLLGFTEYLLLRNSSGEVKVLVPKEVQLLWGAALDRTSYHKVDAVRAHYVYDIHPRFQCLGTALISGRIYLAALYAASGTLLAEPRHGTTGDEQALQLIRQSWVNRQLDEEELCNLHLVVNHSARSPALYLLCHELYMSSQQLSFLYQTPQVMGSKSAGDAKVQRDSLYTLNSIVASEYMSNAKSRNVRSRLTAAEEWRILHIKCGLQDRLEKQQNGRSGSTIKSDSNFRRHRYDPCVTFRQIVEVTEVVLSQLVVHRPPPPPAAFPLDTSMLGSCEIARTTIRTLESEYKCHTELMLSALALSVPALLAEIRKHADTVTNQRKQLEQHLLAEIVSVPAASQIATTAFRLDALINEAVGRITINDLMRIAAHPEYLNCLNPFFCAEAAAAVQTDIELWLKLCVLEDKLERLERQCSSAEPSSAAIIQDLLCVRNWNAAEHVDWLVFEAEGRLQIRPAQYTMAQTLIENKGAIAQLNMGEGKTRVILPMLILHWGRNNPQEIVRLHFLTQLLDDAFNHCHQFLCASALNRKIFLLPFNRDVELTAEQAQVMRETLLFCKQSMGCVFVAPEHRLSLQLKTHELQLSKPADYQEIYDAINSIHTLRFIDMLDESDEILRTKYQLIYSVGSHGLLKAGTSRWTAVQAVLNAIETDVEVVAILSRPNVSVRDNTDKLPQAFNSMRFIPGENLDAVTKNLCTCIANAVFSRPPHEFKWMLLPELKANCDTMLRFVTDTHFTLYELQSACGAQLSEKRQDDLLSLRGLLAYRMLFTAMEKRHRVNYGVRRTGNCLKRIAVPFKASDTPHERSEFSHPDMAIALTVLSYYYDGLSRSEVLEAFGCLLSLNESAQKCIYDQWLGICEEGHSSISSVQRLDLSNEEQVQLLVRCFHRNREVVNFWLNSCVLPEETKQYSDKLVANSWDIANNAQGTCMGFAGTDDTSLVLPLQVHKQVVEDPQLKATNGSMLVRLLSDAAKFEYLDVKDRSCRAALLDRVVQTGSRALIDVGALCTGFTNLQVAEYLLERLDREQLKGVVYFDDVARKWTFRDFHGYSCSLTESAVRERNAFVYFDESRCRGADMKLLQNATAVVTLGLKMCKDKFSQGVLRMRQFGRGQKVLVMAVEDVAQQILTVNGMQTVSYGCITMQQVMQWVMHNTVEAIVAATSEWAHQGMYFCTTSGNSKLAKLEEKSLLRDFYTEMQMSKPMHEVHQSTRKYFMDRVPPTEHLTDKNVELVRRIDSFAERYGRDVYVVGSRSEEEAEKQLEKEAEKELERESQLPVLTAVAEKDWEYDNVLTLAGSIKREEMRHLLSLDIKSLSSVVQNCVSAELALSVLPWVSANVFCTANYIQTVKEKMDSFEEYLRVTDACLYFPATAELLLLSEREADAILYVLFREEGKGKRNTAVQFMHLSDIRSQLTTVTTTGNPSVPALTAFLLMLFNGDTAFPQGSRAAEVMRSVLQGNVPAQLAALKIPVFRGKGHLVSMSDLDEACLESK